MRNQWVQKIIILLFLCCVIAVSLGYWLKSTPPSEELVQIMVLNGIDEGKACLLVLEAIKMQLLRES